MKTASKGIVHVVDDDTALRKALGWLVESVGLEARLFASADAFIEAERELAEPNCLVLDVRLRGMSGLELLEKLQREGNLPPTILITAFAEFSTAVRALKGGAIDILRKPFADQDLIDRIWQALELSRASLERENETGAVRARFASLSAREVQVVDLIVAGLSSARIAEQLKLSRRTVEGHRAQIHRKMGADSLADLVRQVLTLRGLSRGASEEKSSGSGRS